MPPDGAAAADEAVGAEAGDGDVDVLFEPLEHAPMETAAMKAKAGRAKEL
jgi:hypothetical protein